MRKTILLLVALLVQSAKYTEAQGMLDSGKASRHSTPQFEGPINPEDLERFFGDFFNRVPRDERTPGAALVAVKGNDIVFKKGYGYADLLKKNPVKPDDTLFRVGSISKLITATAVMQLVERGKLDPRDDINKYLKRFQIRQRFNNPITTANLLTHTHGLDIGWYIGWVAPSAREVKGLGDFLAQRLPVQVEPPGEKYLYSDVGMVLAGYLVEEVSGQSFNEYIEQNIFRPLDMRYSSFRQPPPPPLRSNLATGYVDYGEGHKAVPFLYFNTGPADAMSGTVTDIARFMIAHLQNGMLGSTRLLRENSVQQMQRRQFAYHPRMPGVGYGFHVAEGPRQTIVHHGGHVPGFTSLLLLLPKQNFGFFVVLNSEKNSVLNQLLTYFFRRYSTDSDQPTDIRPVMKLSERTVVRFDPQLGRFAGTYRYDQYPRSTIEKLGLLADLEEHKQVEVSGDVLVLSPDGGRLIQVEPLVFRLVSTNRLVAFGQDRSGRIAELFTDEDNEITRYERLAWYRTVSFQRLLIGCFCIAFLTAFVRSLRSLLRHWCSRHGRKKHNETTDTITILAHYLTALTSALNLAFIVSMGRFVLRFHRYDLIGGVPQDLSALLIIPPITSVVTLCLLFISFVKCKSRNSFPYVRVPHTGFSIAATAFVAFLYDWNLLGL